MVEPIRRRCIICKKKRVIFHHKVCGKCWKMKHGGVRVVGK
jgi:hypothetical protein